VASKPNFANLYIFVAKSSKLFANFAYFAGANLTIMSISLLKAERKALILKQINIHTRVTFNDLTTITHVSEDTIRRDLNEMAQEGSVIKVRGGAMISSYHPSAQRSEVYAQNDKQKIAHKALSLLKDGMFILIGGGTTVRELIKMIPDSLKATFITVNPFTAMELLEKPNLETIMIGGKMSKYSQMAIGGEVMQQLAGIKADLSIFGTNAIDAKYGLSDSDWDTVQIKKAMIQAAEKTAILTISEKLDSTMRLKISDLSDIQYLITELAPQSPILQAYTEGGVVLL
jgi:DeoR family transcriptional regulator, fructose operon transcriptional repressor